MEVGFFQKTSSIFCRFVKESRNTVLSLDIWGWRKKDYSYKKATGDKDGGAVCHKADMWVSTDCGNLNAGYSYPNPHSEPHSYPPHSEQTTLLLLLISTLCASFDHSLCTLLCSCIVQCAQRGVCKFTQLCTTLCC